MRRNETARVRARILVAGLMAALMMGACSSGSSSAKSVPTLTPEAGAARGAEPRYAKPGPYQVGVTTIDLADRKVEVYYPAKPGSTKGRPTATYKQTDPISPELLASLPKVPANVDLTVKFPAVRDVPVATDGPFPLVLFSHGAGGWRGVYSYPLSGLASWGFVVASTDFAEYGLLAQFAGGGGNGADRKTTVPGAVNATIDALSAANRASENRFRGAIDTKRIGAVGHSAGGGTMFGFLNVLLAAALAAAGAAENDIRQILEEENPRGLRLDADGVSWGSHRLGKAELAGSRAHFAGFGSCSFNEPVNDLHQMGLL